MDTNPPSDAAGPFEDWWKPEARELPLEADAPQAGIPVASPPAEATATTPIALPVPPPPPPPVSPVPPVPPGGSDATVEGPPPPGSGPVWSKAKVVAVAVAALVLASGAFLGVRAATSHSTKPVATQGPTGSGNRNGRRPGGRNATVGTLAGVKGSVLTVTTTDGRTVTVNTSASTTVTAQVAATLADVQVGHRVTVRGTSSGAGALTADQITDTGSGPGRRNGGGPPVGATPNAGNPGAPGGPGGSIPAGLAAGTVSAVNGTTITVTGPDGTATTVTPSASLKVTTLQPSSVSALATGQTVRVLGPVGSDGSVTATSIQEGSTFGALGGRRTPPTTTG
ncbi:MAG: DUF5666 domain-containing protein [Acidimicrobiales bacterium]